MPTPRVEEFTGDGATKAFALKGPIYNRTEIAFVNGQFQNRAGYAVSVDQKTVTFDLAPALNDPVTVSYSEADS